ncbi:MAG: glycine cleavage system protein GcvH [Chloroflexi bacterium]|nr:glycine cleavage system protein GcvH [Chloroflexota bacterium]
MSKIEPGLFYTQDDEWLRVEGDEAVIGISDHAQDALSDIVYLELPNVGDSFEQGDAFGVIESVKAAADLFMPVAGEIIAVNNALVDSPEQLNSAPYASWLVRIKLSDLEQVTSLMDADAYLAYHEEA